MKDRADMIVEGSFVITVDDENRVIRDGAVVVEHGLIIAVDKTHRIVEKFSAEETIDARRSVVMPGFVNAHMHETLIRGFWDIFSGKTLYEEMLMAYFMELCVSEKHALAAARLNQLEMIKNGTTCFIDIWRHTRMAAETLKTSGLRGVLAPQIADETPWPAVHKGRYWMESVQDNENLVRKWNGEAGGRIHVWFGPHAPYSCSEETLAKVRELASKYGVGIHMHVSEGMSEVEDLKRRKGLSPVKWLEKIGFLGPDVHAAHCVWLDDDEIKLFKRRGVSVAHMPKANMKSGMGIAPILRMLSEGITVGIGTDSNMGPNNLDMFEEMRAACYLHRVSTGDSSVLPASKLIRMATIEGAKCLRLDKEVGSLEPGKRADIIIIDLNKPHLTPILCNSVNNVMELIVFSAWGEDVSTVIVDGKVLMEERRVYTLDEGDVIAEANKAAADLMSLTIQRFESERDKVGL